jgi:CheY-like chemotaxis protein
VGLPPKVILLDLRLPKVDGIEVLRTLKNDPRTRTIPVVMLTSSKEHQDIDESYRLGVNSYVGKPVRYHEFLRVVSEIECYWLSMNHAPSTPPFRLPPCPNP